MSTPITTPRCGASSFLGSVLVCLAFPHVAVAQLADSPWPTFGGDLRNSHQSRYLGSLATPELKWSKDIAGSAVFQPTITEDGGILFSANADGLPTDSLIAFERDGTVRWTREHRGVGNWSSADTTGRVYYGQDQGAGPIRLSAIRQDNGQTLFDSQIGQDSFMQAGTKIAPDGSVYAGHQGGLLTKVESSGMVSWTVPGGGFNTTPAVSPDGSVVTTGSSVRSYSEDGDLIWDFDLPSAANRSFFFSPAIAEDGTVYAGRVRVGSTDEELYAFDTDGSLLWTFEGAGGAPAIGPDGTIYAGHTSTLFAINPDGTEKWSFNHGPRGDTSVSSDGVTIDRAGNIYVPNAEGILYQLSQDGEVNWTLDLAPDRDGNIFPSNPVFDTDGTMYIGLGITRGVAAYSPVPEPGGALLASVLTGTLCLGWRNSFYDQARG